VRSAGEIAFARRVAPETAVVDDAELIVRASRDIALAQSPG
jgi:hypothetical protein